MRRCLIVLFFVLILFFSASCGSAHQREKYDQTFQRACEKESLQLRSVSESDPELSPGKKVHTGEDADHIGWLEEKIGEVQSALVLFALSAASLYDRVFGKGGEMSKMDDRASDIAINEDCLNRYCEHIINSGCNYQKTIDACKEGHFQECAGLKGKFFDCLCSCEIKSGDDEIDNCLRLIDCELECWNNFCAEEHQL